MHSEEAAHKSTQHAYTYLIGLRRRYLYPTTEELEIDADKNQDNTEDSTQQDIVHPSQIKNRYRRHDNKGKKHRQQFLPYHVFTHSHGYNKGCRHGQQSTQRGGFAERWHEERKHRHDKDAETESCSTLYKTSTYTEEEYDQK